MVNLLQVHKTSETLARRLQQMIQLDGIYFVLQRDAGVFENVPMPPITSEQSNASREGTSKIESREKVFSALLELF
jgi:hypothetical protein